MRYQHTTGGLQFFITILIAPGGELSKGLRINKTKSNRVTLECQIRNCRLFGIVLVVESKERHYLDCGKYKSPSKFFWFVQAKEKLRYELTGVTHS